MATFRRFEDIDAWQKARELVKEVYKICNQGAFSKDFGLKDQICRAGVSIMSNIAEGFERGGTGEFIQFLSIAKGSSGELRSQLYVAIDQNYIDESKFNYLYGLVTDVASLLAGLISYLNSSKIKGTKYK